MTASLAITSGACSVGPPDRQLDVVIVTIDTLRADHLGCYGHPAGTSPTLDRLAASSVLFEHAVAQSAITPVSHASILTGLNPYRHGLRSLHGGAGYALASEQWTLAEILRSNGYATGAVVSAFPATRHFGLDQGFEDWDEGLRRSRRPGAGGAVDTGLAQRQAGPTTDRALAWLAKRDERPFFLWVHYFDVHDAMLLPPREILERFPPASTQREDVLRAIYDAQIAHVDEQIGRVLAALDQRGSREHTVIAVLADHGEGLGDHGWWGHGILFQEQIRVPWILAVPGSGWRGRVGDLVRTIDLVPTLLDVLGVAPPAGLFFDGSSLRGVLSGSAGAPGIAYSESLNDLAAYYGSPTQGSSLYAVNDGRHKLLSRFDGMQLQGSLLYDLRGDPHESQDLWATEPAVARRLSSHLSRLGAVTPPRPLSPLDPEAHARLRALGYVK